MEIVTNKAAKILIIVMIKKNRTSYNTDTLTAAVIFFFLKPSMCFSENKLTYSQSKKTIYYMIPSILNV